MPKVDVFKSSVQPVPTPRIEIDPNQTSRKNSEWIVASLEQGLQLVVGQDVTAVQPEDDEADFVGRAVVAEIDADHGLVYLKVDWVSFANDPSYVPALRLETWEPTSNSRAVRAKISGGRTASRNRLKVRVA